MEEMTSYMEAMVFDLEKIFDFVFQDSTKGKTSEIRQVYDKSDTTGDLELVQKSMAEVKTDELSASANIRYDFIKLLVDNISQVGMEPDLDELGTADIDDEEKENLNVVGSIYFNSLGQIIALNTLKTTGMIKTIDIKDFTDGKE